MSDETMGEAAEHAERFGTYKYVGPDGMVWDLQYIGSVQLIDGEETS